MKWWSINSFYNLYYFCLSRYYFISIWFYFFILSNSVRCSSKSHNSSFLFSRSCFLSSTVLFICSDSFCYLREIFSEAVFCVRCFFYANCSVWSLKIPCGLYYIYSISRSFSCLSLSIASAWFFRGDLPRVSFVLSIFSERFLISDLKFCSFYSKALDKPKSGDII
jgi:hypothetical protein